MKKLDFDGISASEKHDTLCITVGVEANSEIAAGSVAAGMATEFMVGTATGTIMKTIGLGVRDKEFLYRGWRRGCEGDLHERS